MFTLLLIVNGPQGSHDHLLQTHNVVQLGLLCGGEHELRTKDKVRILLNFLFVYLFIYLHICDFYVQRRNGPIAQSFTIRLFRYFFE